MIFETIDLPGALLLRQQRRSDERGYFSRTFCEREFSEHGLAFVASQINTGFSPRAGTLRGMHFQDAPHAEIKVVRCTRGAVYDVIVDLRPDSPTFKRWYGAQLTAENGDQLVLPAGTAHGYLTLVDDTELMYATDKPYAPDAARGVRYDDPAFGIVWPADIRIVSAADRNWPAFVR